VAVNGSWRNFAIANHMHNDDNGLGVNYHTRRDERVPIVLLS
jgi:hypothetical protein